MYFAAVSLVPFAALTLYLLPLLPPVMVKHYNKQQINKTTYIRTYNTKFLSNSYFSKHLFYYGYNIKSVFVHSKYQIVIVNSVKLLCGVVYVVINIIKVAVKWLAGRCQLFHQICRNAIYLSSYRA